MPSMSRYMTPQPWTIRKGAKMSQAHHLMRVHAQRLAHAADLDHGKLVGVVNERDLNLIETLPGGDPDEVNVEDAMVDHVYVVAPEDPVDTVVEKMADQHYGSAVVVNRSGTIEGIFTTIDALQVLADVLRRVTA